MQTNKAFASGLIGLFASLCATSGAFAQTMPEAAPEVTAETPVDSLAPPALIAERENQPLYRGTYFAPLGSYLHQFGGQGQTGNGYGGILGVGYRQGWFSIEGRGCYTALKVQGGDPGAGRNALLRGFSINGMLYPLAAYSANRWFRDVYAILGVGAFEARKYPANTNSLDAATYEGGFGQMIPLKIGAYEFGLRGEALFRYGNRLTRLGPKGDLDAPHGFDHLLVNVGLQLPLMLTHTVKLPPPEPVAIVPVADTDGDGVLDNADQCPDTPRGVAVDARGCPLPKPECKPMPLGARLSLEGCSVGDVIVLNGVNFEFDQSRLTPNAKSILDQVAEELNAHSDIQTELGGHTDSRGSDDYNQKLSEARAAAVLDYLKEKGVDAARMSAAGFGESRPIADNDTDGGREHNRRVELKITASGSAANAVPAP